MIRKTTKLLPLLLRSSCLKELPSSSPRFYSSAAESRVVKIVEVGPRDGLQNEKKVLDAQLKIELIERLVGVGLKNVEAGSFVSPKWVPQMASTAEVLTSKTLDRLRAKHGRSLSLPVLVPNMTGLKSLYTLLSPPGDTSHTLSPVPISDEIAVFVSASESFSRANLNCSIAECLEKLQPVMDSALARGLKVRGYISVVLGCPFEGKVDPGSVQTIATDLIARGCYEVSLGDTIGVGTPAAWQDLVQKVTSVTEVSKLAAHCHDTYGTGLSNVLSVLPLGIRTIDTSIAGLGGCPYSPGATGNLATEDAVYALESMGWSTGTLPSPQTKSAKDGVVQTKTQDCDDLLEGGVRGKAFQRIAEVGEWISEKLGRRNESRAGRAVLARSRMREAKAARLVEHIS